MKTFNDLKVGDYVYETTRISNLNRYKIVNISKKEGFVFIILDKGYRYKIKDNCFSSASWGGFLHSNKEFAIKSLKESIKRHQNILNKILKDLKELENEDI